MSYSITTRQLQPQPVLVVRRRVKQSEIAAALSEMFPRVMQYAHPGAFPDPKDWKTEVVYPVRR